MSVNGKVGRGLAAALGFLMLASCGGHSSGWQVASRESAGVAPLPSEEPGAVVQVYAARLWGMRGLVADHTWVSVKRANADTYTVYEVVGWRKLRGQQVLRIADDVPDRRWYGNPPAVLFELRGEAAAAAADKIHQAAMSYPYPDEYRAFPGPNSNTFTQWLITHVPELEVELSLRAIGKNYEGEPEVPSTVAEPTETPGEEGAPTSV